MEKLSKLSVKALRNPNDFSKLQKFKDYRINLLNSNQLGMGGFI